MAGSIAAFKDFDAIVGVGVVAGGDVDGEIKAHVIETVIDGGSGEDTGTTIFDAESFEGGGEILQNPLGGFASVTGEENFDVVAGVVDKSFDDFC